VHRTSKRARERKKERKRQRERESRESAEWESVLHISGRATVKVVPCDEMRPQAHNRQQNTHHKIDANTKEERHALDLGHTNTQQNTHHKIDANTKEERHILDLRTNTTTKRTTQNRR
jgi:hypothetical protein